MRKALTTLMVVSFLTGCATAGNKSIEQETQIGVQSKLVKGKTTKQEVRTYYGDPTGVSFTSEGKEQWQYMLVNMKISGRTFIPFYGLFDNGATTNTKQLVILFNGDIVSAYTLVNSTAESKSGLLN